MAAARIAALEQVQPLAWKLPHVIGAASPKKKKRIFGQRDVKIRGSELDGYLGSEGPYIKCIMRWPPCGMFKEHCLSPCGSNMT